MFYDILTLSRQEHTLRLSRDPYGITMQNIHPTLLLLRIGTVAHLNVNTMCTQMRTVDRPIGLDLFHFGVRVTKVCNISLLLFHEEAGWTSGDTKNHYACCCIVEVYSRNRNFTDWVT